MNSVLRALVTALLALACVLAPGYTARAHDPQLSGLRVIVGSGSTLVSVTTHLSQLAVAEGAAGADADAVTLDLSIRQRLHVRLDGTDFVPEAASVIRDDKNDTVMWQSRYAKETTDIDVLARLYAEDPTSKFVVSVVRGGVTVQEALLDAAHPSLLAHPAAPERPFAVGLRYVREGILHIFGGPDHIAFVLGLLLLGGSLRSLLKTVTAFTLAHSITLSLAATGFWSPSPRVVEPLIALSIVCVAAENLRPRRASLDKPPRDLRPLLAFGFGLIHGFGFAGALAEVGLPKDALWVALGSFNVGVECGQAAIVLAVAPLLAMLVAKRPVAHRGVVVASSVLIGLAGLFWFITRLKG